MYSLPAFMRRHFKWCLAAKLLRQTKNSWRSRSLFDKLFVRFKNQRLKTKVISPFLFLFSKKISKVFFLIVEFNVPDEMMNKTGEFV